jgi:hypothetical protein
MSFWGKGPGAVRARGAASRCVCSPTRTLGNRAQARRHKKLRDEVAKLASSYADPAEE